MWPLHSWHTVGQGLLGVPGGESSGPGHGIWPTIVIAMCLYLNDIILLRAGVFFCQSFNTSLCFSDLKTAGHFLHLLLRADVTDPYRVLLKKWWGRTGSNTACLSISFIISSTQWPQQESLYLVMVAFIRSSSSLVPGPGHGWFLC